MVSPEGCRRCRALLATAHRSGSWSPNVRWTQIATGMVIGPHGRDPETGEPWDLSDGKIRTKVTHLIAEGKPYKIVLPPICTAFSDIQAINKGRRDAAVIARERTAGLVHLQWFCHLYRRQLARGAYFLHEHPHGGPAHGARDAYLKCLDCKACREFVPISSCTDNSRTVGTRSRRAENSCRSVHARTIVGRWEPDQEADRLYEQQPAPS